MNAPGRAPVVVTEAEDQARPRPPIAFWIVAGVFLAGAGVMGYVGIIAGLGR